MDIKKIFINCMIVLCIGVIALSVVTVVKREKEPKAEAVVSQDITKNEEIVFDTENIEDTEIEESIEDEAEDIETKIMYANSKVNVRTGPGTNYEKVVELQRGAEIVTVGELDENGWQLIDYEGQEAYILGRYLSEEMPVVTPVTPTTPDVTTTTSDGTTTTPDGTTTTSDGTTTTPDGTTTTPDVTTTTSDVTTTTP